MTKIQLSAPVKLKAKATGPRRLAIVAYGGGLMNVAGFGPVVIDLAGMKFNASLPLLADHENAVSAVVGAGSPRVEAGRLLIDGTAGGARGAEVVAILESGTPLQSSVGAEPLEKTWIEAGETVNANGQSITSETGFWFVTRSLLKEVTVTPLGADGSTSVSLAAARRAASLRAAQAAKGSEMTFDEFVSDLGFDPATLTDEQRGKLQSLYAEKYPPEEGDAPAPNAPANAAAGTPTILASAERTRVAKIAELCDLAQNPMIQDDSGNRVSLLAHAVSQGWSEHQVRREALHAVRDRYPNAPTPFRPGSAGNTNAGITAKHLEAALMVKAGHTQAAVRAYGEVVVEQSKPMHGASMLDFCAAALRISGRDVPRDRKEMIRAAMSGGDWTNLLSNVAGKVLEQTWRMAPATWRSWCAVKSAPNFKTQTALTPTFGGALEHLPPGGSIRHNPLGENQRYAYRVHQFAAMHTIDRTEFINDDLGAVSEIIPSFAKKAMCAVSDLVYANLFANANSPDGFAFFGSDHGNNQSGGPSALSATSLAVAVRQLREQQDPDGKNLDLTPAVLIVPPALEQNARGLLNSQTVMRDQSADLQPEGNTFQGLARLEVESRLGTGVTDPLTKTTYSGSDTRWFLAASPVDVPVVVAFLEGKESPIIESFNPSSQADRLEYAWRVVHDAGTCLGDFRAIQRSVGA